MKKQCPQCGDVYPEIAKICARDRTPLVPFDPASIPPVKRAVSPTSHSIRSHRMGTKNMLVGAVIFLVGLAITVITYGFASSEQGGGTYFVAWGAILVGGWRFLRGLAQSSMTHDRAHYDNLPPSTQDATAPSVSAGSQRSQDPY